jgi:hypothetical protein
MVRTKRGSVATEASLDTTKKGREARGLGPFSGGQLTAIIMTLAVLLLFPIGAWAVSFSNVSITDPGGVNRAKVNTKGRLLTTVAGTVTVAGVATQVDPTNLYTSKVSPTSTRSCILVTPPSGHVLVITSVREFYDGNSSPTVFMSLSRQPAADACSGPFAPGQYKDVAELAGPGSTQTPAGTNVVTFPSGLPIPDGGELHVSGTFGGVEGSVTVNGYLLPDSFCPNYTDCTLGDQ